MNKHHTIAIAALCMLAAAFATDAAQDIRQVQIVAPSTAAASRAYTVPGRTEAFESSTIFTRATGIVKERRFDIGDAVKADEIMAIIDTPEVDRAVESAQAAIDQAVARADNSKLLAARADSLLESRAISREEADRRRADSIEQDAAVRYARTEFARLQEQQRFATVRAPFDGVIAGRNFDRGDRVRGDSATADGWLYRLVRLDQLRFVIAAPPDLALQLRSGAVGRVRFNEFPGRTVAAKFYRSSSVFDERSGTMRVELLVENADLSIPAGLTGTAMFDLEPDADSYLVPANTIIMSRGDATLAVVEDGKVRFIGVGLGRNLGTNVQVHSRDLAATSQVIINPNAMLRSGDEVSIAAPAANAPSKAP